MNLDNVTAELRPRGEWESADLGVRMIRRDAATIYKVWFAVTLPLLLLTILAIVFTPYATLATIIYWWLEPVTDGPILHIISRRLFGEQADFRASLRTTATLARRNWIFLFSPYRFHLARSIAMPITQLEGLGGNQRRQRAKVLNRKIFNHGVGVTAAYQHLILSIYFGVMLVVIALVPPAYQDTVSTHWFGAIWVESSRAGSIISLLLFYVAQSALHPWFVGAGFGLYINCRTQLEAWDIEVAFRRMVQRRAAGIAATVTLALALPLLLAPDALHAQESSSDDGFAGFWDDQEIQPALEAILASEELNTRREYKEWARKDRDRPQPERDDGSDRSGAGIALQGFGRFMAGVFEFGLWLAAAFLVYLLYVTRRYWLPYVRPSLSLPKRPARVVLASGEITAETLPDDIPAEAWRLWQSGAKRGALSVLFRGNVFAAVALHGVRLPHSATEGDCISAVSLQANAGYAEYFVNVVTTWSRCAYASREPSDDVFSSLCADWPKHCEVPA